MISYYFKSDEITTLTKEINLTTADNQNRGKGKKKKSDPKMGACAPIKRKFELNTSLINYFKLSLKISSLRCVKDVIMISQFYFQLKKAKETTQTLLSVLLLSWELSTEYLSFQVLSTELF